MDLIDRQAAIDALKPCAGVGNRALDKLRALPSVETKKGRWMSGNSPLHKPICSECGNPCIGLHAFDYNLTAYCPSCGAKMEGEDNETD